MDGLPTWGKTDIIVCLMKRLFNKHLMHRLVPTAKIASRLFLDIILRYYDTCDGISRGGRLVQLVNRGQV